MQLSTGNDMQNNLRVVLDTNIFVSGLLFGGKPRALINLARAKKIQAVSSLPLLAELAYVLHNKFDFDEKKIKLYLSKLEKILDIVYPEKKIKVLRDEPDNRVLEAAVTGKCNYIITGDRELLNLKKFRRVRILTTTEFLNPY